MLARDPDVAERDDVDRMALRQVRRSAEAFARQLGLAGCRARPSTPGEVGWLLALAWPDRIARAREPGSGRYLLSNGRGAFFAEPQSLARSEYLVIPELEGSDKEARIHLAAPLTAADLEEHLADRIVTSAEVRWDSRERAVAARRQRRLGALVLADEPLRDADAALVTARHAGRDPRAGTGGAALDAGASPVAGPRPPVRARGTGWQGTLARRQRYRVARHAGSLAGPVAGGRDPRHAPGARRPGRCPARPARPGPRQQRLDELAPTHLTVPSGSRIAIDYLDGPVPSLSVRLQEVFGLTATPRVAGGRVPVLLKLLSPARRPVQVTQDLESFWNTAYHEVRKELKGRYPRHYWPEDPRQAEPTKRVKPRQ